jgi:tetratricopeptide (TPR) repeat protein
MSGDDVGAAREFQETLRLNPRAYEANFNLAKIFMNEGNLEEARRELLQILQLRPDYAPAHYELGMLLAKGPQKTDILEARVQFDQALRFNPDFAEAHKALGDVLASTLDFPSAIDQFQAAIRLRPNYPEAYYAMGMLLQQSGEASEAITAMQNAVKLKSDYAEARLELGTFYLKQKKPDSAIEELNRAVELTPASARAHYLLGRALALKGDTHNAEAEFQESQKLQHQTEVDSQARNLNNDAVDLLRKHEPVSAGEKLRKAILLKPGYTIAYYNLGLVLAAEGNYQEAINEFRTALKSQPDNPEFHLNLGRAMQFSGDVRGATSEFQKAIALKPDYTEASNALKEVGTGQNTPHLSPGEK